MRRWKLGAWHEIGRWEGGAIGQSGVVEGFGEGAGGYAESGEGVRALGVQGGSQGVSSWENVGDRIGCWRIRY